MYKLLVFVSDDEMKELEPGAISLLDTTKAISTTVQSPLVGPDG